MSSQDLEQLGVDPCLYLGPAVDSKFSTQSTLSLAALKADLKSSIWERHLTKLSCSALGSDVASKYIGQNSHCWTKLGIFHSQYLS